MPYNRPGPGVYVTWPDGNDPLPHGAPCVVDHFVGVSVKQRTMPWTAGFQAPAMILPGEPFFIITKGVVQVSSEGLAGAANGDEVYIEDDGTVQTAPGANKFGRVVDVQAGAQVPDGLMRGTPAARVRIDLDAKDSF